VVPGRRSTRRLVLTGPASASPWIWIEDKSSDSDCVEALKPLVRTEGERHPCCGKTDKACALGHAKVRLDAIRFLQLGR